MKYIYLDIADTIQTSYAPAIDGNIIITMIQLQCMLDSWKHAIVDFNYMHCI